MFLLFTNVSVRVHLSRNALRNFVTCYLCKNLELKDIVSLFSCNRGMCLLENETHVANYCTFNMKETNA